MKLLNQSTRYDILRAQFNLDSPTFTNDDLSKSLNRLFSFIYEQTKVMYIEFIDEKVCRNYIKFHHSKNFSEVSYMETLKDIKNFNYFLHNVKAIKDAPKIKLSIKNSSFWISLD
ncbi:hypothetical protein [Robertmurraya kyonggiensis]|uniref:Phage integrase SAM-like domain-containing protein n=1 Tax=Robertmurraya kyonggiensis TaxID=1037680 RepID=A0A4U1D2W1_9BACI|nr:hypothetical protein [Robertmurraya kyonggiensis]TKC16073.1 hypothetical protein FA727_14030 [Robertmurraya kyonggiensis]